jgi:hypothetical protein
MGNGRGKVEYPKDGISDNEKVVTTDLATVVEGSDLRVEEDEPSQDTSQTDQEVVQE